MYTAALVHHTQLQFPPAACQWWSIWGAEHSFTSQFGHFFGGHFLVSIIPTSSKWWHGSPFLFLWFGFKCFILKIDQIHDTICVRCSHLMQFLGWPPCVLSPIEKHWAASGTELHRATMLPSRNTNTVQNGCGSAPAAMAQCWQGQQCARWKFGETKISFRPRPVPPWCTFKTHKSTKEQEHTCKTFGAEIHSFAWAGETIREEQLNVLRSHPSFKLNTNYFWKKLFHSWKTLHLPKVDRLFFLSSSVHKLPSHDKWTPEQTQLRHLQPQIWT